MKMNVKTENYEFSFNEGNKWYLQLWKKNYLRQTLVFMCNRAVQK